ncbi:ABC transporter substrate-binding protein [Paenibacillus sp. OV219]|uniref:ABC transporter substrate-binding protein n=1 Tax=Paenibacillus sp. OV219 TaxID=1884377 RepID=UPI0008D56CD7|nr:ABC transporter substrate-binding protein [Paenibacillus sp. OV219]SEO33349.1 carbohydrate ABC transporter substrate-binding protein, CUT1 family [Paenibacillus sp. OV219]
MKKFAGIAMAMVLGTGIIAGCGDSSSNNAETASSSNNANNAKATNSAEKKVITISVRENTWGARKDNFIEAEKRLNKELESENAAIKIDWWPGIDDEELVLQAQAGKTADIFINSSVDIGWERDAGIIRDIDWVGDSEVFKSVPESYVDIMKYDGHYYGAIQDMDASPVFISRKALQGLGWSPEQIDGLKANVDKGDFTFEDLVGLAEQAKSKKLVKMGFAVEDKRFEGFNYAFGFNNYDASNNMLELTPDAKNVYSFWADAKDRGVIAENIGDLDTEKTAPMFVKGEVFAQFARTEFYGMMREANGMQNDVQGYNQWFSENVVWIPVPSAEKGGSPVSYSNPAMIFVGSKVEDDKMPYVQRLIEHVLDPDLQVNHTLKSGKLPVTPEAQEDPRFKEMPFYKDHAYMVEFTKTRPALPDYATFIKAYTLGVDSILTKGKDAAQALDIFTKDVKQNVPSDRVKIE